MVVIPTRYEPQRVLALVDLIRTDCDEIILLDNGHEQPLPGSIDARGLGLYAMWNQGWQIARSRAAKVDVAILNDDIRILPGTLRLLSHALRKDPTIGAVHPDARYPLNHALPHKITYTTQRDPAGSRELTGYCFMFKGELPLPPFDEGMEWWYGDTEFDESVRLAGYGVARVDGVPIEHTSDAEANGWARRPELSEAIKRDGIRWAELHQEIRDGKWWPISERV